MDGLKKFFSEPGTVITLFSSGLLGIFVGVANGVIQKRHGGWPAFWGSLATGVVIATLVGLAIAEYVKTEAMRFAIIGACAVISDDIWAGLKTFGSSFRSNPLETIFRIMDAVRGRPALPAAAPPVIPKEE
jgi:hypothetical protein